MALGSPSEVFQLRLAERLEASLHDQQGRVIPPYIPHPGQALFHSSPARFRALACHRRWGKDRACIVEALNTTRVLSSQPRPTHLIPKVHAWFVYPTYKLARPLWEELKRLVPSTDLVKSPNNTDLAMDLRGDIRIEVRSADDPEKLVAIGLDLLIMGEAARMKREAWDNVRPALDSPDRAGLCILNSTPKGRDWFWRLWLRGQNRNHVDWESWNIPALTPDYSAKHPLSNPGIPYSRIEEARGEASARWFRQEYMAEFLTDEGAVFRNVRDCVRPVERIQPPISVGVDPSLNRPGDYTAFAAIDARGQVLEAERYNEGSYGEQAAKLLTFIQRWQATTCVIEENIGQALIEMLATSLTTAHTACEIIPFWTSTKTKRELINPLVVAFEQRTITLPDDPDLLNELETYEATTTVSGNVRYSAEEGEHDDLVMALALAYWHIAPHASKPALLLPMDELGEDEPYDDSMGPAGASYWGSVGGGWKEPR